MYIFNDREIITEHSCLVKTTTIVLALLRLPPAVAGSYWQGVPHTSQLNLNYWDSHMIGPAANDAWPADSKRAPNFCQVLSAAMDLRPPPDTQTPAGDCSQAMRLSTRCAPMLQSTQCSLQRLHTVHIKSPGSRGTARLTGMECPKANTETL